MEMGSNHEVLVRISENGSQNGGSAINTYLVRAEVTMLSILSFDIAGRLSSLAAISLYAASFILSLRAAIISSVFFSNS